jgi:serine/threonine protein kinase
MREVMSRASALDTITRDHEGVAGSPAYLAPERWRGHAATARSDLFSLGALLLEARTGQRVFDAPNPVVLRARILAGERAVEPPADLAWIELCLAVDPERRAPDARTLRARIARGSDGSTRAGRTSILVAPRIVARPERA